jgi:hypothetical protein
MHMQCPESSLTSPEHSSPVAIGFSCLETMRLFARVHVITSDMLALCPARFHSQLCSLEQIVQILAACLWLSMKVNLKV